MKYISCSILICLLFSGCSNSDELVQAGQHYQKYNDYKSLSRAIELMQPESDTSFIKSILGSPIAMDNFDYRYLIDSVGPNGCPVGAVFNINEQGKADRKWLDEICE